MNESVKKWLDELMDSPLIAIQKLILGYAGVEAWSRSSLRESFVEIYQHDDAKIVLDEAVAEWLEQRLMKLPPENTPTLVWASHLQDLFSALTGLPLPQVAQLLRNRLRDFRSWLRPLRTSESLDPEATYLSALAWAETNQHLEGLWQRLVLRTDKEPAYYIDVGLLGLRKTRDEQGRLPEKAPMVLLTALLDHADAYGTSEKKWRLTTMSLLGGYRYDEETWIREFTEALNARPKAKNAPIWLKKILPNLQVNHKRQFHSDHCIQTALLEEKKKIIDKVKQKGPEALRKELTPFLDQERLYAKITRNPHYLVLTFNNLAKAAGTHDPDWAVARSEEALIWDNNNPQNWIVFAQCLWMQGIQIQKTRGLAKGEAICQEAIDTLWTARFRFPWDHFVRNQLSHFYRDAGDLWSAEAIYRETIREFPDDVVCRAGLADLLMKSGRLQDAEKLYRETMSEFPKNVVCRAGLADLLMKSSRLEEAETIYRETMRDFPKDTYSRTGLAEILFKRSVATRNEAEREEARKLLKEVASWNNLFAQSRLQAIDQQWMELTQPQQPINDYEVSHNSAELLETLSEATHIQFSQPDVEVFAIPCSTSENSSLAIEIFDNSTDESETLSDKILKFSETPIDAMRPAQRLGRALLLQWKARHTTDDFVEQESLFTKAETLLNVPNELTGECQHAFIEARGFLLLSRNQLDEAKIYFEEQVKLHPTKGLYLGLAEVRTRLGEQLNEIDEAELKSFGADGSILLLILQVLYLIQTTTNDDELYHLLIKLYPAVTSLLKTSKQQQSQEVMLANFLHKKIFQPLVIFSENDFKNPQNVDRTRNEIIKQKTVMTDMIEKFAMAA